MNKNTSYVQPKYEISMQIGGMSCASCVTGINKAVSALPGVRNVNVNLATETVTIEYSQARNSTNSFVRAIQSLGYSVKIVGDEIFTTAPHQSPEVRKLRNQAILSLLAAGLLIVLMNAVSIPLLSRIPSVVILWSLFVIATLVQVGIGRRFYVSAWRALRIRTMNMNTLVSISIGAAYVYSVVVTLVPTLIDNVQMGNAFLSTSGAYYEVSAFIVGFVTLGKWLERRATARTVGAIRELIQQQPPTARVLVDEGVEKDTPINEIVPGVLILVRPGETVPVDGLIEAGHSTVNQAVLTGEALPVEKTVGDSVLAGTGNGHGMLTVRVKETGTNTVIGNMIATVQRAMSTKAPIESIADRISARFVPFVLLIALTSFGVWAWAVPSAQFVDALLVAIGVLVVACPCALGLATPTAVAVGIGRAASKKVLIRDATALETTAKISTVALDKTGTITTGQPRVTSVKTFGTQDQTHRNELLTLAASAEVASEHPLALAIVQQARTEGLSTYPCYDFQTSPGRGAMAVVNRQHVLVGNLKFMQSKGLTVPDEENDALRGTLTISETQVFVATDGHIMGVIGISDYAKSGVAQAITELREMGLKVAMLTGDGMRSAREIATQVGINEVHSDMLPADKSAWIAQQQARGEIVAMVGDGINDALALTTSNLGVAMAHSPGATVDSAKAIVKSGNPRDFVHMVRVARSTMQVIKQNLFWAFAYNLTLIPIAAGVLYFLFQNSTAPAILRLLINDNGLLNPSVAAAAMAASSVTVVVNSLRSGRL